MKIYTRSKSARKIKISLFYKIITFVFVVAACVSVYLSEKELADLKVSQQKFEKRINEELTKQEEIRNNKDYLNSDAYIEKTAREQLGYVKSNDIVYTQKQ